MKTKSCTKCQLPKPLEDYYLKDRSSGRRFGKCKSCVKEDRAEFRRLNPDYHKDRYRAQQEVRLKDYDTTSVYNDLEGRMYNKYVKQLIKESLSKAALTQAEFEFYRKRIYIAEHLLVHPCVGCDQDDITVLQFDHYRGEKAFEISAYVSHSLEEIIVEIDKCQVLCASCHMKKTHPNTWKSRYSDFL